MSVTRKVLGVAGAAAGVAAAGAAVRVAQRRRVIAKRGKGDKTPFGSLRAQPLTVVADDGLPLYAEIDEFDPKAAGAARRKNVADPGITVVFIHGYALNLDCWHFQRAGYRGLVRTVYYDQRSHGRSERSPIAHASVDQLGRDLFRVLEDTTGDDPVILIGHSMGGMTIMSLADQHPELFGTKVIGTALISTTAGGLDPGRILFPMMPRGIGGGVMGRVVKGLSFGHKAVDKIRGFGRDVATVLTDAYAFGEDVPAGYVAFVRDMIDGTPFEVVAEFFPAFAELDVWDAVGTLAGLPTSIICGTADKITSVGHSRKLHARIHGSDLLECEGAGHMVIMERHDQVNAELDQLIAAATERLEAG